MQALAYYNGKVCPADEMTVSVNDRAFYFGDGIYDVTSVHNGKCFALDDHLDRFWGNSKKLSLDLDMTKEELRQIVLDFAANAKDVPEAILYFQASRGSAPRNHAFPQNVKANLYLNLKETKMKPFGQSVKAITMKDIRFEMCDIKTLNLLPNCLAQQKAVENGCYEAILYRVIKDGEKEILRVTEGSHSAVALLKDNCFITPPLDSWILPSVSRKHYIELCTALGIRVFERAFTKDEMMDADEVLIMSSTALENVCSAIDGTNVGGKAPELVKAIGEAYAAKIVKETK